MKIDRPEKGSGPVVSAAWREHASEQGYDTLLNLLFGPQNETELEDDDVDRKRRPT